MSDIEVEFTIPDENIEIDSFTTQDIDLSIFGVKGRDGYVQYTAGDNITITDENVISASQPSLTDYVKKTDYATNSTGGVIKVGNSTSTDSDGTINCATCDYTTYSSMNNKNFISKGTLENVITGKGLTTKSYVDGLVGDISSVIDAINGESI